MFICLLHTDSNTIYDILHGQIEVQVKEIERETRKRARGEIDT